MPFTFAHPLVVLPLLKKKCFSATGLIVGSIAPDFESFMKMRSFSEHSHTLAGLLYFDLPLGFFLAWLFHNIMKEILLNNSPSFVQQRFVPLRQFNFRSYLMKHYWVFTYSVLVGSATHLLWDSFTHGGAFMSSLIPFLHETVVPFRGARYPMWYTLQNISSVLGLLGITLYFLWQKPQACSTTKPSAIFWPLVVAITAFAFYLRYQLGEPLGGGNTVVALVAAFLLALVLTTVLLKWGQKIMART